MSVIDVIKLGQSIERKSEMTQQEMKNLKLGDLIRNVPYGNCLVVTANFGDRTTAVRTADITNPSEWELVKLVKSTKEEKPEDKLWNYFVDRHCERLPVIPLRQILEAFFYYIREDYDEVQKVLYR